MTSDMNPQIKAATISGKGYDRSEYVYFRVNVRELFNIDLRYPGIITALNNAMRYSKQFVPMDTGLTRNSMEMHKISDDTVEIMFNPQKIIGKKRKGVIVKEYYVKYIAESPKNFNWLSVCIYKFYNYLYEEVRRLFKKHKEQNDVTSADAFMLALYAQYINKKREAKQKQDLQAQQRKLFEDQLKEKKRLRRLQNVALKDIGGESNGD